MRLRKKELRKLVSKMDDDIMFLLAMAESGNGRWNLSVLDKYDQIKKDYLERNSE